jgi:hypothetical protein
MTVTKGKEPSLSKKPQGSSKPEGREKHPRIPMKLQRSLDSQGSIYQGVNGKDERK